MVGRNGKKLYRTLVEDPVARPWSKTHSWQSWRDRYVKRDAKFNGFIEQRIKQRKAELAREEEESSSEPEAATGRRRPVKSAKNAGKDARQEPSSKDTVGQPNIRPNMGREDVTAAQAMTEEQKETHLHEQSNLKRKRTTEPSPSRNVKVPRKASPQDQPPISAVQPEPSTPLPGRPSLYPDLSSFPAPHPVSKTIPPKPYRKTLHKKAVTPEPDSGFGESSPSAPHSPLHASRPLPRQIEGPFGTRLVPRSKPIPASDDEDGRTPPLVSSQEHKSAPGGFLPALVASRLAAKKRAASRPQVSDSMPQRAATPAPFSSHEMPKQNSTAEISLPLQTITPDPRPPPAPLTAFNKPGESSKTTLEVPVKRLSSPRDDVFSDAPHRLTEVPRIDLASRRLSSSKSRRVSLSNKRQIMEVGMSVMIADWAKRYQLGEGVVRDVWDELQDLEETENVLERMRKAMESTMKKEILTRRDSGARRKGKRPSLNIRLLEDDEQVDGGWRPPSETRAGKFVKLANMGRTDEAIERDQRRASGGIREGIMSSPIKQETPSPPERIRPVQKRWAPAHDLQLLKLNSLNIEEGRSLEDTFGYDRVLQKIEELLL